MDRWPGYAHERMRLDGVHAASGRVPNPVVLTGDIHSNWVNDLRVDDRKADTPRRRHRVRRHVDLQRRQRRGSADDWETPSWPRTRACSSTTPSAATCRCTVTPDAWRSDFRVVKDVTRPGAAGYNAGVVRRRSRQAGCEASVVSVPARIARSCNRGSRTDARLRRRG